MKFLLNIDVDDIDRAIDFYGDAFGLRLGRRLFEGSVAELHGGSATVYLLVKAAGSTAAPGTAAVRNYRRHWTPVHLDVVVDDLAVAVARAVAAGAVVETPAESFVWGAQATLSDPFGHGFCLLQFSGSGYDAVE